MSLTCYTAPGVIFESEAAMKEHYRSDWHRANLKRKVAGLPPLAREVYEERMAAAGGATGSASGDNFAERANPGLVALGAQPGGGDGLSRKTERRLRREVRQQEKHTKAAMNTRSKAAHYEAVKNMSEHEYIEHKMATAEGFDEGSDLFSRHHSPSLEANLQHMAKTHGFYIPYLDYVSDLPGLLGYLLEMVYVGNVALVSGKQFHSLEAVQAHMREVGGCRMELEGHEEEYEAYYDLNALAVKSPLWEWVEEELLTEAQADKLTDAVASGEATEEGLIAEWTTKLQNAESARRQAKAEAKAAAKAAQAASSSAAGDDVSMASSRRSTVYRVRFKPVAGGASEAGSLTFGRRDGKSVAEVGHRSMKTYYKQSYKPSGGSVGASNPELHDLLLSYAAAGVLAQPISGLRGHGGVPAGGGHEKSKQVVRNASKMFVAQGLNNNMTQSGRKHFKNQSLNF